MSDTNETGKWSPRYVVQHHWTERPTLELPEHWDVRIRNEDGYVWHWLLFGNPLEGGAFEVASRHHILPKGSIPGRHARARLPQPRP